MATVNHSETRVCRKCGIEKPRSDFGFRSSNPQGSKTCKACLLVDHKSRASGIYKDLKVPDSHFENPATWLKPGDTLMAGGYDFAWCYAIYEEIPDFSAYTVGTNGFLWSRGGNYHKTLFDRWSFVGGSPTKEGYRRVTLCSGLVKWNVSIHELVLTTFVGSCPPGMECRHLNGNPSDNRLANLCWGTPLENAADKRIHGTLPLGSRTHNAKMTERDVEDIYRRIAAGETYRDIGASLGVDESRISHIVRGDEWKHATSGRDPLPNMLIGSNNRNAKLTEAAVVEIRRLAKGGMTQREIGLTYGINKATVCRIVNRKWWAHVAD